MLFSRRFLWTRLVLAYLHRWQLCSRGMKVAFSRFVPHRENGALGSSSPSVGKYDKIRGMILCLSSRDLVAFPRLVYAWKSRRVACVWIASCESWREEGGQVHESSERDHNDQAKIWQLYTTTICLPNKPVVITVGWLFTWLFAQCRITCAPVKYTDRGQAA
jgi:hypothetical protein